ncbi:MAG: DsbC family protein [Thermodesulfobacteriota bacterium]
MARNKLSLIISFAVSFTLLMAGGLEAFERSTESEQDCAACHSLSKDEASKILRAEVTEIREAPIKGLWAVKGLKNEKRFVVYIDYGKRYVVLVNRFISVDDIAQHQRLRKLDISMIPTDDAIVMGNPDAKTRIIVFDDPDCPYCRKLHVEIKKIIERRSDIAFLIKLFPLDIHPQAYDKSRAILCEKSAKLLDDALTGKTLPKPTCEAPEINENIKLAKSLGILGTPAIILPDGRLLSGYVEADVLLDFLDNQE